MISPSRHIPSLLHSEYAPVKKSDGTLSSMVGSPVVGDVTVGDAVGGVTGAAVVGIGASVGVICGAAVGKEVTCSNWQLSEADKHCGTTCSSCCR